MSERLGDCFADTAFWIALVVKQDQYHERAREWSVRLSGRITTTLAVLLETANALARPAWRAHGIALLDHIQQRSDVSVLELDPDLWRRGWELYRTRPDKGWSLTDCISFLVMQDGSLTIALTADEHFRQAGFRAILLEQPD
jgi:predicted nucleic acid-binding protein